jgi:hypothetical protein
MAEDLLLQWAAQQDKKTEDLEKKLALDEESDGLPGDWRLEQSTSTKKYFYFNAKSRERYWKVDGAPAGWGFELVGKRKQYINIVTGLKSYKKVWESAGETVHGLPSEWSLEFSKSAGKPYYYNKKTKTTFWRDPEDQEGFAYKLLPGGMKECFHVVTGEVFRTSNFTILKSPEKNKDGPTEGKNAAESAPAATVEEDSSDGEIIEDEEDSQRLSGGYAESHEYRGQYEYRRDTRDLGYIGGSDDKGRSREEWRHSAEHRRDRSRSPAERGHGELGGGKGWS